MKIKITLIAVLFPAVMFAFHRPAAAPPAASAPVASEPVAEKADAFVVLPGDSSKFGSDSAKCVENLSLYREYYKQKNYKDATPYWRSVFLNCPGATKNTFLDGVYLVKLQIDAEKDAAKKEKLIDTLMMVYDKRIEYFGQPGFVKGRKGVDMFNYRANRPKEVFEELKKAFDLDKNQTEAEPLQRYFQVSLDLLKAGTLTKETVIEIYENISDALDFNLEKDKENKYYLTVKENVDALFTQIADCPSLSNLYGPKVKANPTDTVLLRKVIRILDRKNCTEEAIYIEAAKNLFKVKPSATAAVALARAETAKGNASEGNKYMLQAIELETENDKKAGYYYELAVAMQKSGDKSGAKSNALKAASLKGDWGMPYILIGDLYAASASSCGENECDRKAPYWAAVDKYNKAKAIDASVADEAAKRINTYSRYFPITKDCFFLDIKAGDTFSVGCWINETTTVRLN